MYSTYIHVSFEQIIWKAITKGMDCKPEEKNDNTYKGNC